MHFLDSMTGQGPRESIAVELSETIFFGDLGRIKAAQSIYTKVQNKDESFYMIPFGKSKNFYGYAKVEGPRKILFRYRVRGKTIERKVGSVYDAKRLLCSMIDQY